MSSHSSRAAAGIFKSDAESTAMFGEMKIKITNRAHDAFKKLLLHAAHVDSILETEFAVPLDPVLWDTFDVNKVITEKETRANVDLVRLVSISMHEIETASNLMHAITSFLELQVPTTEDGNNFGVEVLETCAASIRGVTNSFNNMMMNLPSVFGERIKALEMAVEAESVVKSKVVEETEHAAKKMRKTTEASETTSSTVVGAADAALHLHTYDVTTFWSLKTNMRNMRDTCIAVHDMIQKNHVKLLQPKNESHNSTHY